MRLWYGRVGLLTSFVATLLVITSISTAHWGVVYDRLVPDWWKMTFGFWEYCFRKCYPLTYVYDNPCISPDCGSYYSVDNGTITSSSYNITTHKFTKTCVWVIDVPNDLCATLKINDLDLGRATKFQTEEKLIVYDYETMTKLYRFTARCRPRKNTVIATPSSKLRLVFVGKYKRARGFNISWTSEECPTRQLGGSSSSTTAVRRVLIIEPDEEYEECYYIKDDKNYFREDLISNNSLSKTSMDSQEVYISRQSPQILVAPPPVSPDSHKQPHQNFNTFNDSDARSEISPNSMEESEVQYLNKTIVAMETASLATVKSSTGALWIQFTDFDIQCGSQHFYIYAGAGTNKRLLSGFCGTCKPGGKTGIMVEQEVTLTFWSRDGTYRDGREFALRFSSIDPEEITKGQLFTNTCHAPDSLPAWFVASRLVIVIATLNCLLALPLGVAAICPKCCTKTGVLLGTVVVVSIGSAILFIGAVTTIAVHYQTWPLFMQYGALQGLEYSSHVCLAGVVLLCISAVLYLIQWAIVGNDDDEHIYEL